MSQIVRYLAIAALAFLASCSVNTDDLNPHDGWIDVSVDDIAPECSGLFVEITIIQGNLVVGPYSEPVVNGGIHFRASEGTEGGQHADADLKPDLPIEIEIKIIMISDDCKALIEHHLGKSITAGANGTVLTSGNIQGSGGHWSRDFSAFTIDSNPH